MATAGSSGEFRERFLLMKLLWWLIKQWGLAVLGVGHLNHGVSVGVPTSSGMRWQNYDVLDGPMGDRSVGSMLEFVGCETCPGVEV
jgi:hypothetical protein